jgi:bifunctional non-homologous end joining protein LigD
MALREYRKKRDFATTPEPSGEEGGAGRRKTRRLVFVVQKHLATQLHYDLRLEWKGVLLSWAVPKGPSLDPTVRRLAMPVEDHPMEYASFEGVIPEGEYGGGTVMVWDQGTWEAESPDVEAALEKGDLKFTLRGKKLQGSWVLVRTRGYGKSPDRPAWLLIKHRDAHASTDDITTAAPRSVATDRLLADIARDGGSDVERAATADPKATPARASRPRRTTSSRKPASK